MNVGLAALRLEPLNQRVVKDAPKSKALLHLAFSGGSEHLLVQGKAQEKLPLYYDMVLRHYKNLQSNQ